MYDNHSDSSDINSEDLDKILENMEDLDDALLRGTLKSGEQKKETTPQSVETKKKVVFRDFNEDDPLADLLSEDDTSKETSIPVTTSQAQNKKIADLFGIKTTNGVTANAPQTTQSKTKSNSLPKENSFRLDSAESINTLPRENSMKKISNSTVKNIVPEKSAKKPQKSLFDDSDDIISNLTEKPRPISEQAKKSSLMENLFSGLTNKSTSDSRRTNELASTQSKVELNPTKSSHQSLNLLTKSDSIFSVQSTTSTTGYSPTTVVSVSRESRRGRRPSTGLLDPLGLLGSDQKTDEIEKNSLTTIETSKKEEKVSKNTANDNLPEWLGGRKSVKEEKSEEISASNTNSKQIGEQATSTLSAASKETEIIEQNQDSGLIFPQTSSILLGTQFDQQAALVSMQQQENILRTASTLSQHNDKFTNLLENQTLRLNDQEKQFNMLITRQIERQTLLEAQMKMQQNRIDSYLQTLMSQPTSMPLIFSSNKTDIPKDFIDKNVENESHVQKLQLEKLYLESTIESLREKHEKEMTIFDESYKKQVKILEDIIDRFEQKMQLNFDNLEADYEAKLQKLKVEMTEMEKSHKEEKEELKKEHLLAIQQIYERHSQSIILLQNEHAEIIQNITKAKMIEQDAIKVFSNQKENIDDIVKKTDNVIENLQILEKKIEERNDTFHESREIYFQTQADHLKLMREQVNKQNETSEVERKQLLLSAQKLEESAIKLAFDTEKRNRQFAEMEDRLKLKEQAFLREKELFSEQTKWERNHLEDIKQAWCKEQEKRIELLAKERQALIEEKGKLEISNRLKSGNDDAAKAELEEMIKSAQEAAENAFRERRKWQERINEIELQKNVLQEKEDQLVIKAKELESLTQSALTKREEGLRALKEAHRIEEESKERMNQVQTQFEILAQRENRIAAEKLTLARGRLSLKIGHVERPEKDINIIEPQEKYIDETPYLSDIHSSMMKTHFSDIVDPQLILLKLDLDNKLDASSQYFDYIPTAKH